LSTPQPGKDAATIAEYRLLNALIHDKAHRRDSRVHEELFVHETAKSIYKAIESLDQLNIQVTEASLLQEGNALDYSVNKAIVDAVYNFDTGTDTLDDILATLASERVRLSLQEHVRNLQAAINKGGKLNYENVAQKLFDIDLVLQTGGGGNSVLQSLPQWTDAYIEDLKERAAGRWRPYGDELLDRELIKGAYPGAITTIAAATGQGKTTYVTNIVNNLINMQVPCINATLELGSIDVYDRLIAIRRKIPLEALYSHDPDVINSIISVVQEERKLLEENKNFYLVDEPSLSLARLRPIIKEFKQRTKSKTVTVLVDLATQLREFTKSANGMNMANSIEVAMNEANALAKEENAHLIFIVQFNRDADSYKISSIDDLELLRPSLNDIKNSQAIAERSRVVLGLFRKKPYADRSLQHIPEAAEIEDIMEVQILKSTNGAVGKILKYYFDGMYFSVTPMLEDSTAAIDIDY